MSCRIRRCNSRLEERSFDGRRMMVAIRSSTHCSSAQLRPVSTRLPDEFVSVDSHAQTIDAVPAVAASAASSAAAGLPSAAPAAPRVHALPYLPSCLQSTPAATVPVARWREPSPSVMHMLSSGVGFAHSLKSSLKYSFAHFSRAVDSPSAPTQGWTFGASAELAGIGVGDAKFIRVVTEAKKFWPLCRGPQQTARGAEAASSTGLAATLRSMHLSLGVGGLAQYLSSSRSRVAVRWMSASSDASDTPMMDVAASVECRVTRSSSFAAAAAAASSAAAVPTAAAAATAASSEVRVTRATSNHSITATAPVAAAAAASSSSFAAASSAAARSDFTSDERHSLCPCLVCRAVTPQANPTRHTDYSDSAFLTSTWHPRLTQPLLLDQPIIQWPQEQFIRLRYQAQEASANSSAVYHYARLYRHPQLNHVWDSKSKKWVPGDKRVTCRLIVTVVYDADAEVNKTRGGLCPDANARDIVALQDLLASHANSDAHPFNKQHRFSCGVSLTTFVEMASGRKPSTSVHDLVEIEVHGGDNPRFVRVSTWRAWLMDTFQFCIAHSYWRDSRLVQRVHAECCGVGSAPAPVHLARDLAQRRLSERAAALDFAVLPPDIEAALETNDNDPCSRFIYLGSHTDLDDDMDAATMTTSSSSSSSAAAAPASSSSLVPADRHLYKVGMKNLEVRVRPYHTHNPHFRFLTSWEVPKQTYASILAVESDLHALLRQPGVAQQVWRRARSADEPVAIGEWFTNLDRKTMEAVITAALLRKFPEIKAHDWTRAPQKAKAKAKSDKKTDVHSVRLGPTAFTISDANIMSDETAAAAAAASSVAATPSSSVSSVCHRVTLTYPAEMELSAALLEASKQQLQRELRNKQMLEKKQQEESEVEADSEDTGRSFRGTSTRGAAAGKSGQRKRSAGTAGLDIESKLAPSDDQSAIVLESAQLERLFDIVNKLEQDQRESKHAEMQRQADQQLKANFSPAGKNKAFEEQWDQKADTLLQRLTDYPQAATPIVRVQFLTALKAEVTNARLWQHLLSTQPKAVLSGLACLLEAPFQLTLELPCAFAILQTIHRQCIKMNDVILKSAFDPNGGDDSLKFDNDPNKGVAARFQRILKERIADSATPSAITNVLGWKWATPEGQAELQSKYQKMVWPAHASVQHQASAQPAVNAKATAAAASATTPTRPRSATVPHSAPAASSNARGKATLAPHALGEQLNSSAKPSSKAAAAASSAASSSASTATKRFRQPASAGRSMRTSGSAAASSSSSIPPPPFQVFSSALQSRASADGVLVRDLRFVAIGDDKADSTVVSFKQPSLAVTATGADLRQLIALFKGWTLDQTRVKYNGRLLGDNQMLREIGFDADLPKIIFLQE